MCPRRSEHSRVELRVLYHHQAALVTIQLKPFFLISRILLLGQEEQQQKRMVLMLILLLPLGHQEHCNHPQGHFINHPLTNQKKMEIVVLLKLVHPPVLALRSPRIILWNWLGALHVCQVMNKTQMNRNLAQRIVTPQIWSLLTIDWDQKGSKNWNTGKLILYRVQIPLVLYAISWCCPLALYPLPSFENPTFVPYWSYFYICSILKMGGRPGELWIKEVKPFVVQ